MYALAATEAVGSIAYLLLACTGIAVSAFLWDRLAAIERTRGAPASREGGLMLVYAAALVGGLTGAKLAFLAAEGWNYADDWSALLSGKSITGALLGGYASVEIAKRALGITRTTGDRFAVLVPASIGIGRIGGGAVEATARQPEAASTIQAQMILTAALIEGVALFAVVVCLLGVL